MLQHPFDQVFRLLHQVIPVQQQVVVVEEFLRLLAPDIRLEELPKLLGVVPEPGEVDLQRVLDRLLRVDAARVDRHARSLAREPHIRLVEFQLAAHRVEQVLGIRPVHHSERLAQPSGWAWMRSSRLATE